MNAHGRSKESPERRFITMQFILVLMSQPLITIAPGHAQEPSRAGPDWWSLQPITRPEVPVVSDRSRTATAIDCFVASKLEANGLALGPEAERRTLLRRLKFDLHGLPPTPPELNEFLQDRSPDAYDRLVDRLLDSPRYGERWARHWLDVVRFAESNGYERDRIRENGWRYRDWVIRAFNDDKPYRDFVCEQIAGDAIHGDDAAGAVPTGFLVTGPNNDVGNQSQLELMRERADELDEIVQNVSSVFLGLTVGCARCHDHKFDPIPTLDYYRMAAVFSGVKFGDRPLLPAEQAARASAKTAAWDSRIKEINQNLSNIRQDLMALGGEVNARRNDERFPPVESRFVRLTITATQGGIEPGIDEIEIYDSDPADGSDPTRNLALASRGAKATASSLLPGHTIHQVHHLNDGLVGNANSWISNEKGTGWAQIELADIVKIARVVWGRDRDGQFNDRLATAYRLEYSLDGLVYERLPAIADVVSSDPAKAEKIAALKAERTKLQQEKKSIDDERSTIDTLPKAWAALSTAALPLKVLKRGDVQAPGEDALPGALSAIRLSGRSVPTSARRSEGAESRIWQSATDSCRAGDAGGQFVPPAPGDIGISHDDADPVRRLKLAEWIVHSDNPLTWRVIVNRVWQYHFGVGLLTTPSDFGAAGARPSHPELLDWLADEFRVSGGRFKALHRMIVRSAVYRQRSAISDCGSRTADSTIDNPPSPIPNPQSIDSDNRLVWRANRRRLDAETLRDSILFVSGKINFSAGGPSYRPFKYVDGNIPVYEPVQESPELWRRTVYRHIVRTHRQPFLDTFDCPDPSVMTPVRTLTTTPLQALSLLNNPFVIEQAGYFAQRVAREAGPDLRAQVRAAVRQSLLSELSDTQLETLVAFSQQHGLDSLCRVLFNTNEFIYID